MFLSFIIPLYNASRFISMALDSIYENPLDESVYEVVVIDDGSTDDGVKVVKEYATKHENLRLIQQPNSGASAARNRGIEVAKGEFVWFVDADDRIEPKILETVWQIYKENPQTEMFGFNHVNCSPNEEKPMIRYQKRLSTDGSGLLQSGPYLYLWNRIFKKSAIGVIRFPEGTRNTEDWYFDLMVFIRLKYVECIPENGYYYTSDNPHSTLLNRSRESLRKNAADSQLMHRLIWEEMQCQQEPEKKYLLHRALNYNVMAHLWSLFCDHFSVKEIHDAIKHYRQMGLYPVLNTGRKNPDRFLWLANRPYVLYFVVAIRNIFAHISSMFKNK